MGTHFTSRAGDTYWRGELTFVVRCRDRHVAASCREGDQRRDTQTTRSECELVLGGRGDHMETAGPASWIALDEADPILAPRMEGAR